MREALSLAYTPGVAQPCLEIEQDEDLSYVLTRRGSLVAVITDGTAVLGLGDIGPEAALPVMEGKCVLFKRFADVNAVPICLDTKDPKEIIAICKALAPAFGGFNLEDISAPRCVEIERTLKKELNIPVFHDDQHGTAIVVLAALINGLRLTGRALTRLPEIETPGIPPVRPPCPFGSPLSAVPGAIGSPKPARFCVGRPLLRRPPPVAKPPNRFPGGQ